MATVASSDLHNHTADVLRQVRGGMRVTVTANGEPVAEISPARAARRTSLSKDDLIKILAHNQADPRLRDDLANLAGDDTGDLGPIR